SINNGRPELPYGRKCHEVTSNSTETYILCPSILDNPHPPYTDIAPDEPISAYIRPKTNHTAYSENPEEPTYMKSQPIHVGRSSPASRFSAVSQNRSPACIHPPAEVQSSPDKYERKHRSVLSDFPMCFSPDLPLYEVANKVLIHRFPVNTSKYVTLRLHWVRHHLLRAADANAHLSCPKADWTVLLFFSS